MESEYDPEAWAKQEEDERVREVQEMVDVVCRRIIRREVHEAEARELMRRARLEASYRIPDRMDLYDLIYETRFERLIEQFLRGEGQS